MVEDRLERGRSASKHRRLRTCLTAAVSLLAVAACTPLALGDSGGAGLGASGSPKPTSTPKPKSSTANPFSGRGMWIWYLSAANGGNLGSLIGTAHHYGIKTVLIKSGDGSSTWSQFSRHVVSTLHAHGLRVCGWQYVYGSHPVTEARVGAFAVHNGADCLAIDAESEYEGRYVQAQSYIRNLRKLVGSRFPVSLASFPYVDYHPAFPYSVFMGRGGAQYNTPQMYWRDIGVSVDTVYAHTYSFNRIYRRPIFPLGQVYEAPPPSQIKRFRQLSTAYGSSGLSWWDWQEASGTSWRALAQEPLAKASSVHSGSKYAALGRGAQGDVVVWAQEHLRSAGQRVAVDGSFGASMQAAVARFQRAHSLSASGAIGAATWQALLRYSPKAVTWTSSGARVHGALAAAGAGAGNIELVPKSARLPARAYEIGRSPGRG